MVKKLPIAILFILLFSSITPSIFLFTETAKAKDSVTWENQYGKLTVYPKTSKNLVRQKQYYEITWYYPDNDLDIAFRFDGPLSYGAIYYWNGSAYNKLNDVNHVVYLGKHFYVLENIHLKQNKKITGYWEYNTPVNSKGKWDMYLKLHSDSFATALSTNRYIHLDPWWDSDWTYKRKITINHDQVPETLTNFPILINISSDASLVDNVGYSNGSDIAFTDSTESVQLDHEIELFNDDTGRLVAWVEIPTLSSSIDTDIYLYCGNKNCTNQTNAPGVWDSYYSAVYHMTGANYGAIDDSTSNSLDATGQNSAPIYNVESISGKGVTFDGTDDFITLVDDNDFTFAVSGRDIYYTIEAVFKKTDNNVNPIISKYKSSQNYGQDRREWIFYAYTDSYMRMYQYDEGNTAPMYRTSTDTISNGVWTYAVGQWNSTSPSSAYKYILTYLNGFNNSGSGYRGTGYDYMRNNDFPVKIGVYETDWTTYNCFKGTIDEIRISKNIARNESWIETTYNTIFNATDGGFFLLGAEESIGTTEPPTNLLAQTDSGGNIDLSWTMGANSTHTRIEYNTVSSWIRGTGTLLYNNTGVSTSLTTTSCNIRYYFLAWAYNNSDNNWSSLPANANNISCPGNPSNLGVQANPTNVNISWTNNTYATATLVVRKNGDYPNSPTDGTLLYNGTLKYHVDAGVIYGTTYYALFSYNSTVNRFSTGLDVPLSSLRINVYDENTSEAITNWSIFISNEEGTETYESPQNNNTLTIDINDLPTGEITIIINATNYDARIFQKIIEESQIYTLNVYLAEKTATDQYIITVVGPQGEYGYDPPIEDAWITIRRYINETDGWGNVGIRKTNANGIISINLIPNEQYHVTITKTGYHNFYYVFVPPPVEYAEDRYHTFRLIPTSSTISGIETAKTNITYTVEPVGTRHNNIFTFYYNITSSDGSLQWYRINVWYYNTTTNTLTELYANNQSNPNGGTLSFTIPDVKGKYIFECYFKRLGYDEYEISQTGSLVHFYIQLREGLNSFPDYAWYIITIIITMVAMGFCIRFFTTGISTGYVGLGVMAIMFFMKDVQIPLGGTTNIISGWAIWGITFLIYTIGVFLWSRL